MIYQASPPSSDNSMLLEVSRCVTKALAVHLGRVMARPVYLDLPHMSISPILVVGQDSQLQEAGLEVAPATMT